MSNVSSSTKRWIAVGGLAFVVLLIVVLGARASGDGGGDGSYKVRAIFDTASFLVSGEDVKVAGVKIGRVDSLDVTRDKKAAIVLEITDPAFQDFKRDATCSIRLQSLIGEKFVSCQPTQPKPPNAQPSPPLRRIKEGDHEGQYLLPVTNTSSPVDIDLLNNIMRAPQRQRFALILNELGVGLAGNGDELRRVVRRANPALQQFDRVLAILASQNRVLANLAHESDAALAGVARESASVSDFIDKAGQTAAATAERGDALEANFERFPEFLRQLTPTAQRLGEFADAGTPVMADLRAVAPSINSIFKQLGPFSEAALPTFRTLGDAADVSRRALVRSQPVIDDLSALGKSTKPLASLLARGLTDLQDERGIENLLNVILFLQGSGNGFDSVSHILRTYLVTAAQCLSFATTPDVGGTCTATFNQGGAGGSAASASTATVDPASAQTTVDTSAPSTTSDAEPTAEAPAALPSDAAPQSGDADAAPQSGLLGYLLGTESVR